MTSALVFGALTHAATNHKSYTVTIENLKFSPAQLTVSSGDSITWQNHDLVPHTVTSLNKGFDSKMISPEKSWTYFARRAGTFKYKCSFHPAMTGQFTVK